MKITFMKREAFSQSFLVKQSSLTGHGFTSFPKFMVLLNESLSFIRLMPAFHCRWQWDFAFLFPRPDLCVSAASKQFQSCRSKYSTVSLYTRLSTSTSVRLNTAHADRCFFKTCTALLHIIARAHIKAPTCWPENRDSFTLSSRSHMRSTSAA